MAAFESIRSRCEVLPWTGCWIWLGTTDSWGYGSVWHLGKARGAHRLMYELVNGEIPNGMVVMHSCDNPSCVNPAHLSIGTHADNVHDCMTKGRFREQDRKLTDGQARKVLGQLADGVPQGEIAQRFGIARSRIWSIAKGKTYREVSHNVCKG